MTSFASGPARPVSAWQPGDSAVVDVPTVLDTFQGGPELLTAHAGERGATWVQGGASVPLVADGEVKLTANGSAYARPSGVPTSGDYRVTLTFRRVEQLTDPADQGTNLGIGVRGVSNGYSVYVFPTTDGDGAHREACFLSLGRVTNDVFHGLALDVRNIVAGQAYTLAVSAVGSTLTVQLDGVTVLEADDATYPIETGLFLVLQDTRAAAEGAMWRVQDFRVEMIPPVTEIVAARPDTAWNRP